MFTAAFSQSPTAVILHAGTSCALRQHMAFLQPASLTTGQQVSEQAVIKVSEPM